VVGLSGDYDEDGRMRHAGSTVISTRPIFVAGSARSGTTLLQSALGAHAHIAAPPEMYFVTRISSLADYYGDLRDDGALGRALRATLDFVLLEPLQLDEEELLVEAKGGPRTYGGLLTTVMDHIAAAWGKGRWSDKTPWQSPAAVWELIPDAQVVHIVRDPRDVVASSVEAPWIEDRPLELARAWTRFNTSAAQQGAAAGPSRYHRVRYEDLVADPGGVLRLVCTFLQEDFDGAMLDPAARSDSGTVVETAAPWQDGVAQPIGSSRIGRYVDVLSRRDRCLIAPAIDREMVALGYETPRRRTVVAGRVLRPLELPSDLRRGLTYLRLRRRMAPHQRYAETAKLLASGLQRVAPRHEDDATRRTGIS
jgi:hypothetical protein